MNSLWGKQDCEVGRIYACAAAQLRLWFMRNSQGWQVAMRHDAEIAFEPLHESGEMAEQTEWQRFVTPSSSSVARLVPVLPDRPVVSRPEARIEIAPHHKGRFFVTIPVWIRLEVDVHAGQRPMTLCEFPTRILSKTWFGHPADEGEIGYALTTRARQDLEEIKDVEGRAICPVLLDNGTNEALVFAQLLLSVSHMSVYQTEDGRLWTNECRMGYSGSIFPASLAFGHTAPEQAHGSRLISGPRVAPTTGLTARAIASALFRPQF